MRGRQGRGGLGEPFPPMGRRAPTRLRPRERRPAATGAGPEWVAPVARPELVVRQQRRRAEVVVRCQGEPGVRGVVGVGKRVPVLPARVTPAPGPGAGGLPRDGRCRGARGR